MTGFLASASWAVTGLGVISFVVVLTRRPTAVPEATGLLLEYLLAAGLLRLRRDAEFSLLAAVAAVVALRKVATIGLRASATP